MAKITWLGEDGDGISGPSFTTCFDRKFPKGEPVEISDPDTIKRAKKNPFFKVGGDDAADDEPSDDLDSLSIAELRERAEGAGIDHSGLKKADLRDTLRDTAKA